MWGPSQQFNISGSGCIKDFSIPNHKSLKSTSVESSCPIYLELVTDRKDLAQLYELTKLSYNNGQIWTMYSLPEGSRSLDYCLDQIWNKYNNNCDQLDPLDNKSFYCLFYSIKLQTTKEIIGLLEFYYKDGCAWIGICVDSRSAGRGYGTQASKIAIDFLQNQTDAKTIAWECNSDNIGSLNIAKKCGFVYSNDEVNPYGVKISVFYLTSEGKTTVDTPAPTTIQTPEGKTTVDTPEGKTTVDTPLPLPTAKPILELKRKNGSCLDLCVLC